MTLLTIAGFDPTSGAGITADLAVMAAHGFSGTSAITALTIQSTAGVQATHPVAADILSASLACLCDDLPPAGIKLGMLATRENVKAVANLLATRGPGLPIVLDPVTRSSSGAALLSPEGLDALKVLLLPRIKWITPNLQELSLLSGLPVEDAGDAEQAATLLAERWPHLGIVATGGHLETPDDLVLAPGEPAVWLEGTRLPGRSPHGTGCAFSTALLCGLVAGKPAVAAAREAKAYVAGAIAGAEQRGAGAPLLAPYWRLARG